MDFEDTREEAEYRARAREFLAKNAKPRTGKGMLYRAAQADEGILREARDWQTKKYEAGFAGITWPKEWGGQGLSAIQQVIYDQEEAQFSVPRGIYDIGLGMCLPTVCTWGTQAHRDRLRFRGADPDEEVALRVFLPQDDDPVVVLHVDADGFDRHLNHAIHLLLPPL